MEEQMVYTPAEAVKYLAECRGIQLSVVALRMRRNRGSVRSALTKKRITLWTKAELDAIPVRAKPGRKPQKKEQEGA